MLSPLRNRFGIPGVISVIALVFAMFGGAYAATNNGKAHSSAKAKQGPRGKTGKTGPAGPAGPAGAKGDTGSAGSNGSNGSNGQSVTATSFAGSKVGSSCTEGGIEFVAASGTTFACNGKKGTNGTNGTNGTTGFTDTLPSGKTETGAWGFNASEASATTEEQEEEQLLIVRVPVSFSIPLSTQVGVFNIKFAGDSHCTGTVGAPTAAAGFLCIYEQQAQNAEVGAPLGFSIGVSGVLLRYKITGNEAFADGTFAVTAP